MTPRQVATIARRFRRATLALSRLEAEAQIRRELCARILEAAREDPALAHHLAMT